MAKDQEENQGVAGSPEESKAAKKPKAARKAHWPDGFEPTGDPIKDTKQLLELGPKTTMIIPLQEGDPAGAEEMVQINGYKLTIKKGQQVEIPVPMAQLIANKYKIEMLVAQKAIGAAGGYVPEALQG